MHIHIRMHTHTHTHTLRPFASGALQACKASLTKQQTLDIFVKKSHRENIGGHIGTEYMYTHTYNIHADIHVYVVYKHMYKFIFYTCESRAIRAGSRNPDLTSALSTQAILSQFAKGCTRLLMTSDMQSNN